MTESSRPTPVFAGVKINPSVSYSNDSVSILRNIFAQLSKIGWTADPWNDLDITRIGSALVFCAVKGMNFSPAIVFCKRGKR